METLTAASILLFIVVGIVALLERNHRRTAGLPRAPFGADVEGDADLWRVRHDLDFARSTGRRDSGRRVHHPRAA
jgi:hypothetical protein